MSLWLLLVEIGWWRLETSYKESRGICLYRFYFQVPLYKHAPSYTISLFPCKNRSTAPQVPLRYFLYYDPHHKKAYYHPLLKTHPRPLWPNSSPSHIPATRSVSACAASYPGGISCSMDVGGY